MSSKAISPSTITCILVDQEEENEVKYILLNIGSDTCNIQIMTRTILNLRGYEKVTDFHAF